MKRVLFVVAHPDDAELAAGGTIRMLADSGAEVKVLTLTISEKSEAMRKARKKAAREAARVLKYELAWYEEGRFDHVEEIRTHELVQYLDRLVESFSPDSVFSHWEGDSHWDHVCAAKAVKASSRRWNASLYALPPNEIRTVAYTSFTPNTFVDISPYIKAKMEAISHYSYPGQHFKAVNGEEYKALNRSIGLMANCEFAESFLLIRQNGLFLNGHGINGSHIAL
ncbi:MAG: PIG-L deacetylase family protein [Bacteroidota bacterium]